MLDALTEHDFQDSFKKWQKHWEWCIGMKRDYFNEDDCQ
jgi:hypothetical protein